MSSNGIGSPPVQLGGLASGLDTTSIVSGLVAAESQPMRLMQQQAADLRAASSDLSSVGTALSQLKTASDALGDVSKVGSFTATSSDTAITTTAQPTAQPGSYQVSVSSLAVEQRTYTASFSDHATALGQTGSFTLQAGTAAAATINVTASDTLDSIASKINGAGVRASASVFFDGTSYRIQVRGLDTGAANKLTFTESGTSLDLNGTGSTPTSGRTAQQATDASATIDGFTVTSSTNQITGAIPGVTLALSRTTTSPATVTIASDPGSLTQKVSAFVTAYNAVINSVHSLAGYGTTKGTDTKLGGDGTLRSITDRLSATLDGQYGSGSTNLLSLVGLTSNRDGTLTLDSSKLTRAFTNDPTSVETLLGRPLNATTGGAMATMSDVIGSLTDPVNGALTLHETEFNDDAKRLDDRAAAEQTRLDAYKTQLQAQFTAMESVYSQNQSLMTQLSKLG